MRLSEKIQGGNTTNFLKSLNEGAKLEEARSHKEDNEKAAPRRDNKVSYNSLPNENIETYKYKKDMANIYSGKYPKYNKDLTIDGQSKLEPNEHNEMVSLVWDIGAKKVLDKVKAKHNKKDTKTESTLDEARSHKEDNEKAAPRKSSFDKVVDGEASIGVYDDKDERNYADRYKEPIYAKRNKVKNFTDEKKGRASFKDKFNKRVTHIDYEKPLNKDSADYKRLKADSELPFPDVEAGEKAKEILKRRGIKTESANLEERNLTRAERYNRNMERIWNNYNAQLNRMADYLKQNGFSDEEIEELRKNTGLGASALPDKAREVADKNGPDEWHKVVYGVNESASLKEEDTGLDSLTYWVYVLGYDLLRDYLMDKGPETDITYETALKIAKDFMNSEEIKDMNKSGYDALVDYLRNNGYLEKPVEESCNKEVKTESAKTLTLRPTSSKLNEADSLELKEEYAIGDLDNLVWSGARDRWIDYTDEQKEFLVDYFIETAGYIDGNIPSTTEFNDFIWFEADDILEENGMTGDTSEEDEEE